MLVMICYKKENNNICEIRMIKIILEISVYIEKLCCTDQIQISRSNDQPIPV
jgi:hypothetical protein